MLILLSLLAVELPADQATVKVIDQRLTVAEPRAPRRSPYRLDANVVERTDGKAAAVATTGQRCAVVGQPLCTRKPRTVYSARY